MPPSGKRFPEEKQKKGKHRAQHQELNPRAALFRKGHAPWQITLPEWGMPLVAGSTDMIGCREDCQLMDSFALLPFALGELFRKLLHLAFRLFLEFSQGRFLLQDLLKIPFQLHSIILDWRLHLGSRGLFCRRARDKTAATGGRSRHERRLKIRLFSGSQQVPDPDEECDRAQNQERQGEREATLKPVSKPLITTYPLMEENSRLRCHAGLGIGSW